MEAERTASDRFDDTWAAEADLEASASSTLSAPISGNDADQGPCLYLGPSGQRCERRALEGGYCARHRPGAISLPKARPSRRTLAAIAAIAGVLWPLITDIVREILRWFHSH
jgi:hypothetical protein